MFDFLFDELPVQFPPQSSVRCKDCGHIQRWETHTRKSFFYCGITKSHRTKNGLKKIKYRTPACGLFENKEK